MCFGFVHRYRAEPPPERAQAVLMSQLSRGQSENDKVASRLWALQARLGRIQPSAMNPRSSILGPRSTELLAPGVDTGSKTGTLLSGSLGRSDRPGTLITLPSGQNKNLPPQEVQWMLAGLPAVKIFIQEEGWYRVTQPELMAAANIVMERLFQGQIDAERLPAAPGSVRQGRAGEAGARSRSRPRGWS